MISTTRKIYRFRFMWEGKRKVIDIALTHREAMGVSRFLETVVRKKKDLFDLTIFSEPLLPETTTGIAANRQP